MFCHKLVEGQLRPSDEQIEWYSIYTTTSCLLPVAPVFLLYPLSWTWLSIIQKKHSAAPTLWYAWSETPCVLYTRSALSFLFVLLSLTQPPTTKRKHSSYTGVIIWLLLVITCVFPIFS